MKKIVSKHKEKFLGRFNSHKAFPHNVKKYFFCVRIINSNSCFLVECKICKIDESNLHRLIHQSLTTTLKKNKQKLKKKGENLKYRDILRILFKLKLCKKVLLENFQMKLCNVKKILFHLLEDTY